MTGRRGATEPQMGPLWALYEETLLGRLAERDNATGIVTSVPFHDPTNAFKRTVTVHWRSVAGTSSRAADEYDEDMLVDDVRPLLLNEFVNNEKLVHPKVLRLQVCRWADPSLVKHLGTITDHTLHTMSHASILQVLRLQETHWADPSVVEDIRAMTDNALRSMDLRQPMQGRAPAMQPQSNAAAQGLRASSRLVQASAPTAPVHGQVGSSLAPGVQAKASLPAATTDKNKRQRVEAPAGAFEEEREDEDNDTSLMRLQRTTPRSGAKGKSTGGRHAFEREAPGAAAAVLENGNKKSKKNTDEQPAWAQALDQAIAEAGIGSGDPTASKLMRERTRALGATDSGSGYAVRRGPTPLMATGDNTSRGTGAAHGANGAAAGKGIDYSDESAWVKSWSGIYYPREEVCKPGDLPVGTLADESPEQGYEIETFLDEIATKKGTFVLVKWLGWECDIGEGRKSVVNMFKNDQGKGHWEPLNDKVLKAAWAKWSRNKPEWYTRQKAHDNGS